MNTLKIKELERDTHASEIEKAVNEAVRKAVADYIIAKLHQLDFSILNDIRDDLDELKAQADKYGVDMFIYNDGAYIQVEDETINEMNKANGNLIDKYTFRLIDGDFYEGETVTVETVMDGKKYTRKVKNDKWDLYITIKGSKAYWESDRAD